jgi:hypothetical protein
VAYHLRLLLVTILKYPVTPHFIPRLVAVFELWYMYEPVHIQLLLGRVNGSDDDDSYFKVNLLHV